MNKLKTAVITAAITAFVILIATAASAEPRLQITRSVEDQGKGRIVLYMSRGEVDLGKVYYNPDNPAQYRKEMLRKDINADGKKDFVISVYYPNSKKTEKKYPHYKGFFFIVDAETGHVLFNSRKTKYAPKFQKDRDMPYDVLKGFKMLPDGRIAAVEYFGPTDVRDVLYYFKIVNYFKYDKGKNSYILDGTKKVKEKITSKDTPSPLK